MLSMRMSAMLLGTPSASFELSLPLLYTALRICTCLPYRFLLRIRRYLKNLHPTFLAPLVFLLVTLKTGL